MALCRSGPAVFAQECRVGILGNAFDGMGDFSFDENRLREKWGADNNQAEY